jgi:hypothetical protein
VLFRSREQLRHELSAFEMLPTEKGFRLEAKPGEHDDAVMAAALGVLAARMTVRSEAA